MLLKRQKFEFEDFLLDAKEKTLTRGGKPLSITPKAFQLLLVLVENHGHLVEKDELMNSVWAESFVEEANLAFTIRLLRKALEDDAQNPRFIKTVPKRGYRFIADVKVLEVEDKNNIESFEDSKPLSNSEVFSTAKLPRLVSDSKSPGKAAVVALADWRSGENDRSEDAELLQSPTEISRQEKSEKPNAVNLSGKKRMIAALVIVLFLAGSMVFAYYIFTRKNAVVGDKKSIAVLPLKPINTTNRDEIYEIGIADSLIHRISSM
jgi:DNA-binding winged helix-turn-helix (wHTH) protein